VSTLSSANFTDDNILLTERTNKIKINILGVPVHKLGNWLIELCDCLQNVTKGSTEPTATTHASVRTMPTATWSAVTVHVRPAG